MPRPRYHPLAKPTPSDGGGSRGGRRTGPQDPPVLGAATKVVDIVTPPPDGPGCEANVELDTASGRASTD